MMKQENRLKQMITTLVGSFPIAFLGDNLPRISNSPVEVPLWCLPGVPIALIVFGIMAYIAHLKKPETKKIISNNKQVDRGLSRRRHLLNAALDSEETIKEKGEEINSIELKGYYHKRLTGESYIDFKARIAIEELKEQALIQRKQGEIEDLKETRNRNHGAVEEDVSYQRNIRGSLFEKLEKLRKARERDSVKKS